MTESTIDGFTAGLLLNVAVTDNNLAADLFKEVSNQGGPSKLAIDFFNKYKGQKVRFVNSNRKGTIVGLNKSTGGFYPGSRYPLYIKLDNVYYGDQEATFEYNMSDVVTTDMYSQGVEKDFLYQIVTIHKSGKDTKKSDAEKVFTECKEIKAFNCYDLYDKVEAIHKISIDGESHSVIFAE